MQGKLYKQAVCLLLTAGLLTGGAGGRLTIRAGAQTETSQRFEPLLNRYMVQQLDSTPGSMTALKNVLLQLINTYDGTWSVYMKDLTTGEELSVGDQGMMSASTMKLFILGAVYEAIDCGDLERTSELVDLMSSMIRASSNSAANELIRRLGGGDFAAGVDVVNRYIRGSGYSEDTVLYNGFQEESLHIYPDMTNSTTAVDVGRLLEGIYRRTFARRAVCNEIEEWMLQQDTRYKIPKGLPEGVLVGNKTGETDEIENDCAVIYTPLGDYILCVFSNGWADKETAQRRIQAVSALCYRYYSGAASSEAVLHLPGDYIYADTEADGQETEEDENVLLTLAENAGEEIAVTVQPHIEEPVTEISTENAEESTETSGNTEHTESSEASDNAEREDNTEVAAEPVSEADTEVSGSTASSQEQSQSTASRETGERAARLLQERLRELTGKTNP